MTVEVKICGLRDDAGLDAALEGGADYIGLVLYPRSPRNVDLATARRLAERARGRAKVVALVVDPDDALLSKLVAEVAPDLLQLHGSESVARAAEVAERFAPVLKAVPVATAEDVAAAQAYAGVARILFDAKPAPGAALPGGNGLAFDWQALASAGDGLDFMLAGGLTPENVVEAVRATGAPAVDVSSGVESRPGAKDPQRIARFLRAAKTAKQAP